MRSESIVQVSDDEIESRVQALARQEKELLADLLEHLAEFDRRRLYAEAACSSLFSYCRERLGYSECAAFKRVRAARVARRFPGVIERVRAGQVHLAGLVLLAPHLNATNWEELMDAASRTKSKRELERFIASRFPRHDEIEHIRRLPRRDGPPLPDLRAAQSPAIHEPGRSRAETGVGVSGETTTRPSGASGGSRSEAELDEQATAELMLLRLHQRVTEHEARNQANCRSADASEATDNHASHPGNAARVELAEAAPTAPGLSSERLERITPLTEQRYSVRFSAGSRLVDLVERLRNLLFRVQPKLSLERLFTQALETYLESLERKRMRKRSRGRARDSVPTTSGEALGDDTNASVERASGRVKKTKRAIAASASTASSGPPQELGLEAGPSRGASKRENATAVHGSERSRHIPAAVWRAVWERDAGRCVYLDGHGRRCSETRALEVHHKVAFAKGGRSVAHNLELRCRAHNLLAAEQAYGVAHIAERSGRLVEVRDDSAVAPYSSITKRNETR